MIVDTKKIVLDAIDAMEEIFRGEGRFRVRFHYGDYSDLINALRNMSASDFSALQDELIERRNSVQIIISDTIREKIKRLNLKDLDKSITVTIFGTTPFNDGDECEHQQDIKIEPDNGPSYDAYKKGKYNEFGVTFDEYQNKFNNMPNKLISDMAFELQDRLRNILGTNWQITFSILQDGSMEHIAIDHYNSQY